MEKRGIKYVPFDFELSTNDLPSLRLLQGLGWVGWVLDGVPDCSDIVQFHYVFAKLEHDLSGT